MYTKPVLSVDNALQSGGGGGGVGGEGGGR